jgi:hypothetical protein
VTMLRLSRPAIPRTLAPGLCFCGHLLSDFPRSCAQ